MFKKRDYSNTKFRLILVECVLCQREFEIPYHRRGVITTCCDYCSSVKLSLSKMKGKYRLCRICEKPIWSMPTRDAKYCSKTCKDLSVTIYSWENKKAVIETGRKKYYGPNWVSQRRRARQKASYKCERCGLHEDEYGQELSVHHIEPFVFFETYEEANKLSNLLAVCEPCHRKVHSGENHPSAFKAEDIRFNNELNTVWQSQKAKAEQALKLLLNTDKSLKEISEETGITYGNVQRLYRGDSWKDLYEIPPRHLRPRRKAQHAIRNVVVD